MKIYEYSNISKIYTSIGLCNNIAMIESFLNDIFKPRRRAANMSNILLIISEFGIMMKNDYEGFKANLENINKKLKENNSNILVLRDDRDDIEIFENNFVNFSNIHTMEDISLITTNLGNILCIGGRPMVNKSWYIKKYKDKAENFINRATKCTLDDINNISEKRLEFDYLITTLPPSFLCGKDTEAISNWIMVDSDLKESIDFEELLMDNLYALFRSFKTEKKKMWLYDTYSNGGREDDEFGGIIFRKLSFDPELFINDFSKKEFSWKDFGGFSSICQPLISTDEFVVSLNTPIYGDNMEMQYNFN